MGLAGTATDAVIEPTSLQILRAIDVCGPRRIAPPTPAARTTPKRHITFTETQPDTPAIWRKPMLKQILVATAVAAIGASNALAHVSLETKEAAVGSTYKAVLRVPHGCEGKPTNVVPGEDSGGSHCGQADAEGRLDAGEGERFLRKVV